MTVELAELIHTARAELATAMFNGKDADLKFEFGPIEFELTVAVDLRRADQPDGKLSISGRAQFGEQ